MRCSPVCSYNVVSTFLLTVEDINFSRRDRHSQKNVVQWKMNFLELLLSDSEQSLRFFYPGS